MVFPPAQPRRFHQRSSQRAFSLLELIVAASIMAVLAAIAVPSYRSSVHRANVATTIADISKIALAIQQYELQHLEVPPNLAAIGYNTTLDPWGHRYYYLSFDGLKGHGAQRKNKNLVPINSRYDLYSAGPDGRTRGPLTARDSRDDIILANDGNFIGPASDY